MKLYNKIAALFVCILMITACSPDEGLSIDDHFLNYTIEDIPLTENCPVGVYYYNNGGGGLPAINYARLIEEPNPSTGKVGPWLKPVLENYIIDINSERSVEVVQQHVDWCIEKGGIDFLIFPGWQEDAQRLYPSNVNQSDTTFVNFVTGRTGTDGLPKTTTTQAVVNLKSLKYVLAVNLDRMNDNLTNSALIEDAAIITKEGVEITRIERFNDFFKKVSDYFADPNYYRINNKPIVMLQNAHRLYSKDSRALYDNMRAYVKNYCGDDMFLIAQQEAWTPPARFEYFFINGKVDAITHQNMYNQGTYDRSYWYPQLIDQNWMYSKEFFLSNWGIDYIPTIAPAFNKYVADGATDGTFRTPIVPRSEDTFKTLCNVAKKNLGNTRIVIIDSFNQWYYDTALEPTNPEYGNGYGTKYLEMVKERFKK
ncbi:MAG: glycoside hydrolase family 99-like domain-containing protein [Dysgonamonadaceae bacterium]|jgi:hypothetical protein|nr:glycoside hydrolase family 99-like domain-containing protein [Dysgonamonadaceae bacterium]